ncbi:MAG: superoxide dismutase family protein [Ruminococcus sp.]|nr:superoxide dismutase family protein [Ruminococcus sp.]
MYCNMKPNARAVIKGSDDFSEIRGEVLFYQLKRAVLISAKVSGLPQNDTGFYGFHIHEGSSCEGKGFPNTGSHFNPDNNPHPRHAGDLPPLLSFGGNAFLQVKTNRFNVRDIIGKTVIIHGGTDDFRTQPSGDAGEKIACGVINRI